MKRIDPIVLGIVIFTLIVLGGVGIAYFFTSGSDIERYSPTDTQKPEVEISERNVDLGEIDVKDVATRDIIVRNTGQAPLIISDTFTSCDCTSAKWNINGVESKLFSMSKDSPWRGEIEPNSEAILTVIYEPKIMPVKGKIDRTVTFSTNDPQNKLVNIELTAIVK